MPFRDGVRIHRLYGDGVKGPTAALICFDKGGKIAGHFHEGYEHILVLAGTQRDQHGVIHRGTLRINPPRHHSQRDERARLHRPGHLRKGGQVRVGGFLSSKFP